MWRLLRKNLFHWLVSCLLSLPAVWWSILKSLSVPSHSRNGTAFLREFFEICKQCSTTTRAIFAFHGRIWSSFQSSIFFPYFHRGGGQLVLEGGFFPWCKILKKSWDGSRFSKQNVRKLYELYMFFYELSFRFKLLIKNSRKQCRKKVVLPSQTSHFSTLWVPDRIGRRKARWILFFQSHRIKTWILIIGLYNPLWGIYPL